MPRALGPQRPATPAVRLPHHVLVVVLIALGAVLLHVSGAWAQPGAPRQPVEVRAGGQEAVLLADHIQQLGGPTDLLIATGNVEITQGTSRLLADRVELSRDTGEAVAQGKVVFYDGQDRLIADRIDYNLKTGTGVVYNGSAFAAPYYHLSGEQMTRIGPSTYRVQRGVFTTCEGDDPDWSIRINRAIADLEDIVYGRDASFWVKKFPLLPWVPFFAVALRRERQSGFLFPTYGSSSRKGLFARIPYYWAISDSQDATIGLDFFTRRGLGVDAEYRYILSRDTRGAASGFFINEAIREDRDRERLDIPENRGFFSLKHDWQIDPTLSFKVDSTVTSDDLVFREYGDRLQDRGRDRAETNVFISKRWQSWGLVGNVLWYQDLTTPVAVELQRVPEVILRGPRQPIPGLPFLLYDTQASFTNFIRDVGSDGRRVDLHERVYLPIPVMGVFTITPFAGGRLTYYNKRVVDLRNQEGVTVEDTVHDDRVRRQIEFGFEAETRASRVFVLDGSRGVGALQHVVEPRLMMTQIRGFDQKDVPQWDPGPRGATSGVDPGYYGRNGVDRQGKANEITYSLTNRLNAKTVAGPDQQPVRWEMARLILSQTYNILRASDEPFKDLYGDLIVQPNETFQLRANAAYNMYGLGFRQANVDLRAAYRDTSVLVGSRYNDIAGANYVTAELNHRLTRDVDVHMATSWDVKAGVHVEHRIGVDWRFQCFSISAEYVDRYRNENEFRFTIGLLGLGQVGTRVGTGQ